MYSFFARVGHPDIRRSIVSSHSLRRDYWPLLLLLLLLLLFYTIETFCLYDTHNNDSGAPGNQISARQVNCFHKKKSRNLLCSQNPKFAISNAKKRFDTNVSQACTY
jgi:hypothetical protein